PSRSRSNAHDQATPSRRPWWRSLAVLSLPRALLAKAALSASGSPLPEVDSIFLCATVNYRFSFLQLHLGFWHFLSGYNTISFFSMRGNVKPYCFLSIGNSQAHKGEKLQQEKCDDK